jgi:hypothetical protein
MDTQRLNGTKLSQTNTLQCENYTFVNSVIETKLYIKEKELNYSLVFTCRSTNTPLTQYVHSFLTYMLLIKQMQYPYANRQ